MAALTLYDMLKAADKGMVIGDIRLVSKTGGRSDMRTAVASSKASAPKERGIRN